MRERRTSARAGASTWACFEASARSAKASAVRIGSGSVGGMGVYGTLHVQGKPALRQGRVPMQVCRSLHPSVPDDGMACQVDGHEVGAGLHQRGVADLVEADLKRGLVDGDAQVAVVGVVVVFQGEAF